MWESTPKLCTSALRESRTSPKPPPKQTPAHAITQGGPWRLAVCFLPPQSGHARPCPHPPACPEAYGHVLGIAPHLFQHPLKKGGEKNPPQGQLGLEGHWEGGICWWGGEQHGTRSWQRLKTWLGIQVPPLGAPRSGGPGVPPSQGPCPRAPRARGESLRHPCPCTPTSSAGRHCPGRERCLLHAPRGRGTLRGPTPALPRSMPQPRGSSRALPAPRTLHPAPSPCTPAAVPVPVPVSPRSPGCARCSGLRPSCAAGPGAIYAAARPRPEPELSGSGCSGPRPRVGARGPRMGQAGPPPPRSCPPCPARTPRSLSHRGAGAHACPPRGKGFAVAELGREARSRAPPQSRPLLEPVRLYWGERGATAQPGPGYELALAEASRGPSRGHPGRVGPAVALP